MIYRISFMLLLITVFTACNSTDKNKEQPKPNVLFISIDDLNDWTGMLKGPDHQLHVGYRRPRRPGLSLRPPEPVQQRPATTGRSGRRAGRGARQSA